MQLLDLVQEGVNLFAVLLQLQDQLLLWEGHEGVVHITHPEDGGLSVGVLGHIIEVQVDVVGQKAHARLTNVLEVVQTHLH